MNTFLNELDNKTNYGLTENGAVAHDHTESKVLDMFATGGAYRKRSTEDRVFLFKQAFDEDETLALKCLFYLGAVRDGQGERAFFKDCFRWLATEHTDAARRNFKLIPQFTRWDNLYCLVGTPLEKEMFEFMLTQVKMDIKSIKSGDKTPVSLCGKWLKSCNASNKDTKRLGRLTAEAFSLSERQYRKTLSTLRDRINIVERLITEGRYDEIDFATLPAKAGMKYRHMFMNREELKDRYAAFMSSKETKVKAGILNPVDIAHEIYGNGWNKTFSPVEINTLQKYWDNLKDYYNGREENGIAVVDVSGSMCGVPMEAAVSMGAYIAERGKGPFQDRFITFSSNPQLVRFDGINIVDKFKRARQADWGMNTDIEAVFDLLLSTARNKKVKKEDIPQRLYIFSDMQFDYCLNVGKHRVDSEGQLNTDLEAIAQKWASYGYELPEVIFWNLSASGAAKVPALGKRFSYCSGFSMIALEGVLSGKDGYDMMIEVICSDKFKEVQ